MNPENADKRMLVMGIAMLAISLGLAGAFLQTLGSEDRTDMIFDQWFNSKRDLLLLKGNDHNVDPNGDPLVPDPQTRREGGNAEWEITLYEANEQPLSTPALVDLNNDGDLEIVVASTADLIYAIEPDGDMFWTSPFTDEVIDDLWMLSREQNLDFVAPPIFSSVISADISLGDAPEIIVGVKDGALCIGADGQKQWKKGLTTGHYFSTACITDLEGEWTGAKEDLEIVLASDDDSRRGWLEAFEVDGGAIFREEVPVMYEGGLIGCSVVAADLDGDFWEGDLLVNPDPSKERDTEIIIGNHDRGFRVFQRQGENAEGKPNYDEAFSLEISHQTYATAAVANVSGGPELESFIGGSVGTAKEWTGWSGLLACLSPSGKVIWRYQMSQKPSSIFSSIAIADLQASKFNPHEEHLDHEIIFGSDNGMVYVMDAEYHNLLWSFDTGGRVLSSPAICNIDNDGELEIVIGADIGGKGKVFCFDGDPTDGVDEGIHYPGDGNAHDVLWVFETVNEIGIASPVIGDIDLDGSLEVVIGDAGSHLYCISAGGRSMVGQTDWPQFHCNLNRTGFYNPQTSYGVDIYPRENGFGQKDTLVKSVSPGCEVTYNLTVENIGSGQTALNRDTVYVRIDEDSIPGGWAAWLDTPAYKGNDNPNFVKLASQEKADLTLYVTAPWEGEIGEMASINVSVNSSRDHFAMDRSSTISVLDLNVDFSILFLKDISLDPMDPLQGKKWDRIPPGSEDIYTVSVHNRGNLNDTYALKLATPPVEAGWNWFFVESGNLETEVSLTGEVLVDHFGGVSGETFSIKVVCPEDATEGTAIPMTVRGVSERSMGSKIEKMTRTDELYLVVGEQNEFRIKIEDSTRYVDPNGTAVFQAMIINLGNNEFIDIVLGVDGMVPGWTVTFNDDPIRVYQGQTVNVPVRVKAPGNARADHILVMDLIGYMVGSNNVRAGSTMTVIVNHIYELDTSLPDGNRLSMEPGRDLWFAVDISNIGNGDDRISPSAFDIMLDWNLTFHNKGMFQDYTFDLEYGDTIRIYARLRIPGDTRTGPYVLGMNITGLGSSKVLYATVKVNQTFGMEVSSPDGTGDPVACMSPNVEKTFIYRIKNLGNGLDTYTLRIGSSFDASSGILEILHDGWVGKFVAVSNTPDFTTNVEPLNFLEPIVVNDGVADVYYTPDHGSGSGPGFDIDEIREIRLILDKGRSAWVHVVLMPPAYEVSDQKGTPVVLAASGIGEEDSAVVSLTIYTMFPDLMFAGNMEISPTGSSIREGDPMTIMVKVINTGDISAENVDVQLLVDGKEKKVSTLRSLRNDSEDIKTVVFTWIAETGSHDIEIVIDPENTVIESHDQFAMGGEGDNNKVRTTIEVDGSFIIKQLVNDHPMVSTLLIMLLGIIALLGGAFLLKRRKE